MGGRDPFPTDSVVPNPNRAISNVLGTKSGHRATPPLTIPVHLPLLAQHRQSRGTRIISCCASQAQTMIPQATVRLTPVGSRGSIKNDNRT